MCSRTYTISWFEDQIDEILNIIENQYCSRKQGRQSRIKSALVKAGILASGLIASFAYNAGSRAETAQILTGAINDTVAAKALEDGLNLPLIYPLKQSSGVSLADEQAAVVATEQARLAGILRSLGYLDASITTRRPSGSSAATQPQNSTGDEQNQLADIQFEPLPGDLYRIGSIELQGAVVSDLDPAIHKELNNLLTGFPGAVARADALDKLERNIVWIVRHAAHPYATVKTREIIADPSTATAAIKIAIETGRSARFGPVTFSGSNHNNSESLSRLVPFSQGDPFDPEKLADLKSKLEKLSLFRTINVEYPTTPDSSGLVPVNVRLREKPPSIEQFEASGRMGMGVTAAVLIVLALGQIAIAGGLSRRVTIPIGMLSMILMVYGGILTAQRVLSFLAEN